MARPLVLDAARVKENCFSLSFIAAPSCQVWRRASTGKFYRISRGVRPPQGRVGGPWRGLAGGAGGNCAAAKPVRPRSTRDKPAARQSPSNRPAKGRPSVGQHVFVIGHRVHVPARFVGVAPCGTRGGQASLPALRLRQAGGRVMPGAEVSKDLLCTCTCWR